GFCTGEQGSDPRTGSAAIARFGHSPFRNIGLARRGARPAKYRGRVSPQHHLRRFSRRLPRLRPAASWILPPARLRFLLERFAPSARKPVYPLRRIPRSPHTRSALPHVPVGAAALPES